MLFNSLGFLVFFILVLVLYYSPLQWVNKKRMLLLSSYLFYALWNPPLILLLWISTIVDWNAGNKIYQADTKKEKRKWLWISMLVNLGFLAFFKYGTFLLDNFTFLVNLVGLDFNPIVPDIILPMGISFYTFQTMSYTIDMYYERRAPAKNFLDFALYVTFFPQLVAGPIVRSGDLIPQFESPRKANTNQFLWGLFLLTLGLFQKVVMADSLLANKADTVFGAGQTLHGLDAWGGVLAFSGQIFFDFAGYSTCAIGIAMMLGFVLPDNFRFPYASIGFSDLWRRWHITLSSWLRDYLYIPIGGNRLSSTRTYVNLMITMLLGGLWHGAAWTFVVWGALHGLYLMVERFLRSRIRLKINAWNGFFFALATYFLVNITWVFFRAADFSTAMNLIGAMFFVFPEGAKVLQYVDLLVVFVVIGCLFIVHWILRDSSIRGAVKNIPWPILSILWAIMIFFITISQSKGEQFIYFQF